MLSVVYLWFKFVRIQKISEQSNLKNIKTNNIPSFSHSNISSTYITLNPFSLSTSLFLLNSMKGTLSCFLDHLHSQFLIPRSYLREFKNQLDVFPKTSDIEEQLLCKLSTFLSALSPAEWYQALLKNYLNFKSQQPQQQQ